MQTLQLTTHIENNGQVKLTLPPEYANQDVELVVVIQAKKLSVILIMKLISQYQPKVKNS